MKLDSRGPSHLAAKLGAQCTVSVDADTRGTTSAQAVSNASNARTSPTDRRAPSSVSTLARDPGSNNLRPKCSSRARTW